MPWQPICLDQGIAAATAERSTFAPHHVDACNAQHTVLGVLVSILLASKPTLNHILSQHPLSEQNQPRTPHPFLHSTHLVCSPATTPRQLSIHALPAASNPQSNPPEICKFELRPTTTDAFRHHSRDVVRRVFLLHSRALPCNIWSTHVPDPPTPALVPILLSTCSVLHHV
ncbi:uncharacterized protein M421DRAFT_374165 [Didymella exigua CBS 183.55]|uniref:Uncharacterized protein n=1 Tax=Didymella exigua CBS 183.55 TaxID=1150837 RepID=A0A6A5RTR3_9PLEO|nr:uncharacterized protein M421DRAFT_374165 [Didymella exigua CBS 183.55]KAF1930418.1 hypothetical protein M421DRAFT_374165 [Didymella exigua CBS 183.55]